MKKKGIRGKAKEKDGIVVAKILMSHPMEPGTRKDKKTGELVPAHFVEEVSCKAAGKTVYTAYFGAAISKNPFLSFKFRGAVKGDEISVVWSDNKGESGKSEIMIK